MPRKKPNDPRFDEALALIEAYGGADDIPDEVRDAIELARHEIDLAVETTG